MIFEFSIKIKSFILFFIRNSYYFTHIIILSLRIHNIHEIIKQKSFIVDER